MNFIHLIFILCFYIASSAQAEGHSPLPPLKAMSILHDRDFSWRWTDANKATVLIFLSSTCPCSNAHVDYLENLSKEFKNFTFIGIHSNANENPEFAKKYFVEKKISFEVIRDEKSYWANMLKALRTPHAYIIDKQGKIIYQGGVTGSSDPLRASVFFLQSALQNYQNGTALISNNTRVLGCNIRR